jgi:hypothetical protein
MNDGYSGSISIPKNNEQEKKKTTTSTIFNTICLSAT